MKPDKVRRTPCASCPFRRDVPSGIWSAQEYDKLPHYDGPMDTQDAAPFACHQASSELCAGWAGHRNPADLLAIRLGVALGHITPEALWYRTRVALFASGAEAAAHGKRDLDNPSVAARVMVRKIARVRFKRGQPIRFD